MELDQELSGETAYNDEHAENAECHNQAKNTIHDPAEDQAEKIEDSNCQETEDTEGSNDHETSSSESEVKNSGGIYRNVHKGSDIHEP